MAPSWQLDKENSRYQIQLKAGEKLAQQLASHQCHCQTNKVAVLIRMKRLELSVEPGIINIGALENDNSDLA